MPIIKSAKKAARQAEKRYKNNVEIKKTIKNALKALKSNPSAENLSRVQSEYDKAVKKNLMKKNTASRRKAAAVKIAKAAAAAPAPKATKPASASRTTKAAATKTAKSTASTEKSSVKPATKSAAKRTTKSATKASE